MYASGKLYEASAHICEKQKEKLEFLKMISMLLWVRKRNRSSAFSTKITLCAIYVTDVTSQKKMFLLCFQKISLLIGGALKT